MTKQARASHVQHPAKNAPAQTFVFNAMQAYTSSYIHRMVTVGVMLIEDGTLRKASIIGTVTAFKNSSLLIKNALTAINFSQVVVHVLE